MFVIEEKRIYLNDNKYTILEYSFNTKKDLVLYIKKYKLKKLINLKELLISDKKKKINQIYKLYERNN